jgi:hypothetical protein
VLRSSLTSVASKFLNSEHTNLKDLTLEEQNLWKLFDNSDIYEFITGEPDCLPEFQFDWIEPCQLAAYLPPGFALVPDQHQQAPPEPAKPPVQQQIQPAAQPALPAQIPGQHQHNLYKELHTGVKSKCCLLH